MKRALILLISSLALSACGTCAIYCAVFQTLVFVDANGAPLTPLSVRDQSGASHECSRDGGVPDSFVVCDGNRITYDAASFSATSIRAEAVTGEVFEGALTPVRIAGWLIPPSCGCNGRDTLEPLTVTLTKP